MPETPNPPAFEAAVRDYLEPHRDQFNYDQMLLTFLSAERFRQWARVVARYRPVAGARFLSSGCGFGGSLVAYHDAGAASVTGVEVDEQYVRFAGLRVAELPSAEVLAYDGGRLPFGDAAFDLIESMDVIEHTPDDLAYVRELARVLAPGGLILLVTPNRLWPVEQHLGVFGPPWLPVTLADALFGLLARLPLLPEDRRFRYRKLAGMRTQNVSLRRLRAIAKELGLFLRVPRPEDHGPDWPLPLDPPWIHRLRDTRLGKFLAPTRTLVVTLAETYQFPIALSGNAHDHRAFDTLLAQSGDDLVRGRTHLDYPAVFHRDSPAGIVVEALNQPHGLHLTTRHGLPPTVARSADESASG